MADRYAVLEKVAGIEAPTRQNPEAVLYAIAAASEAWSRLSGMAALLSPATVKLMICETDPTHFNHTKTERGLGGQFRPVEERIADAVTWYADNGYIHSGVRQKRAAELAGA